MSTSMKKALAKAKKVMHPNSRRSVAITKKTKKITKRESLKLGSAMKQNLIGEKMSWLRENMVPDVCPYTEKLAEDLLKRYIARHDEELEQINIKHSIGGRKNRQHASREDIIRMTKKREETEYETCGIEIPDIFNPSQCEMLRKWDGELRYLPNFKFIRCGKMSLSKSIQRKEKSAMRESTDSKIHTNPKKTETEVSTAKDNVIGTKGDPCTMDLE